jgi:hypothetical protein
MPTAGHLRPSQAGFRKGRSCAQLTLTLRKITEACRRYQDKSASWSSSRRLTHSLDRFPKGIAIGSDGPSPSFEIARGVLQGDTLAPFLSIMVLDRVLKRALDSDPSFGFRPHSGPRSPAIRITDLAYADYVAFIASSFDSAQNMLNSLQSEALAVGLRMNAKKTKVLALGPLPLLLL